MFEQSCEESVRKLANRRVDPVTGEFYSIEVSAPRDQEIVERLVSMKGDQEQIVRKRYGVWEEQIVMLEEEYKEGLDCLYTVKANTDVDKLTMNIGDCIYYS